MDYVATPKDAELNAAEVMRSWGYLDAVSPLHSADGGIDVRSTKALAQVKMRGVKAGRPEIQNLVGAREADSSKVLMFFDYKGYSPQAVQYANRMGVGLYVYDQRGQVKPVNAIGRRLMATTPWTKLVAAVMSPTYQIWALLTLGVVLAVILFVLGGTDLPHLASN